jgi:hypothetical protein
VRVGPVELVEDLARFRGHAKSEGRARVPIPRSEKRFSDALTIAFWRNQRIGPPGSFDLDAAQRHAHRKRRVVANYGWAFTGYPDAGLTASVVGISPVLPVPAQTAGFGRVRTVRATVERLDAATVLWPEAINLGQSLLFYALAGPCRFERLLPRMAAGAVGCPVVAAEPASRHQEPLSHQRERQMDFPEMSPCRSRGHPLLPAVRATPVRYPAAS